jgi:DNA-binding NarL/FixJ family response regulator
MDQVVISWIGVFPAPSRAPAKPAAAASPAPQGRPAELDSLTVREREVLRLIAEGCATKEVAYRLGISFKTAACHRYRLMQKLKARDTATIVRMAVRNGLVAP